MLCSFPFSPLCIIFILSIAIAVSGCCFFFLKLSYIGSIFHYSNPILSFFLGPHPPVYGSSWTMGQIKAYTIAVAVLNLSHVCDLQHSSQGRSLTHWVRPRIEHTSSWIIIGFVNYWATMGNPQSNISLIHLFSQRISSWYLLHFPFFLYQVFMVPSSLEYLEHIYTCYFYYCCH